MSNTESPQPDSDKRRTQTPLEAKSGVSQNVNQTGVKRSHASKKRYKVVTKSGVVVQLTRQQKLYADTKLADPTAPLIDAAREAYPNQLPNTLSQQVQQNEKNHDISVYSNEQASAAVITVVELMSSSKEDVRFRAATDILDRTHGKAIQKQVSQNTNLNVNIEASKELEADFTAYLKQKTTT